MADTESRGGQKHGQKGEANENQHKGVEAPHDKTQPGHAASGTAREEFLKETQGRKES